MQDFEAVKASRQTLLEIRGLGSMHKHRCINEAVVQRTRWPVELGCGQRSARKNSLPYSFLTYISGAAYADPVVLRCGEQRLGAFPAINDSGSGHEILVRLLKQAVTTSHLLFNTACRVDEREKLRMEHMTVENTSR